MSNKIYPIGIQNFESLRNDGYFYIDKSLLISALEAYFQGKRELFTGLAMEKPEKGLTYDILS